MTQLFIGIVINTLLFGYIAFTNKKTGIFLIPKHLKWINVLDLSITTIYFLSFLIILLSPGNIFLNIIICLLMQFVVNHVLWGLITGSIISAVHKKPIKLLKLQSALANIPLPHDVSNLLNYSELREKLLNEYIDFCFVDIGVSKVIKDFNVKKEDFKEIYNQLLALGAGQWVNGHYVALSTLAYMQPLEYFLKAKQIHKSDIEIAYNLITYFEKRLISIPNEWLNSK